MTHAIRFAQTGGPQVLRWEAVKVGAPGAGEIRVRHGAVGVNFIDVYHRSGLYPVSLPSGLGMEAAGIVEAIGDDVSELRPGDRVAYASPPLGAYAEARLMPAERVVKLPDGVSEETAAAIMLKGLTAHYLLFRTYPVKRGDVILLHAAAGGVGSLLSQWAKALGATVIGTVGSADKAERARAQGCDHVINYREQDVARRVRELTNGEGVNVVYDSVGAATFEGSLNSLKRLGMLVSFGNASGKVPPFEPALLSARGSLFFTRPTLMDYTARRADLVAGAAALFEAVRQGTLKIAIGGRYPLREAATAHRELEARATMGSLLLLP